MPSSFQSSYRTFCFHFVIHIEKQIKIINKWICSVLSIMIAPEKKTESLMHIRNLKERAKVRKLYVWARVRMKTAYSCLLFTNEDHKHFDVLFFIRTHVSSHYNTLILSPWLFLLFSRSSLTLSLSLFLSIFSLCSLCSFASLHHNKIQ